MSFLLHVVHKIYTDIIATGLVAMIGALTLRSSLRECRRKGVDDAALIGKGLETT